ncbi:MAG: response regulator transcription factor [Bacteroidales bacterium]
MKNKHRVVIVEPSELVTIGLTSILTKMPEFTLLNTFVDIAQALAEQENLQTDIIIINPLLASFHKRGDLKHLFAETKVVALHYTYVDKEMLLQFQEVIGVSDTAQQIAQKLERVAALHSSDNLYSDTEGLSEREKEILVAVAKGLINKEIASLYNLSIHTVITHRKNITKKIGIKSVSGLGVYALLNNMIEEHEIQ